MYLSGLVHRDRLFDVASRWLADHVNNDDGRILTEIFAFERAITSPLVRSLVADLARAIRPGDLRLTRVTSKDAVRKAIVEAVQDPSPRVEQLLAHYREFPEEFFPRTPVHMSLITGGDGSLVGMVRRKRIRRIADKVSRRVADQLAGEIERRRNLLPRPAPGASGSPSTRWSPPASRWSTSSPPPNASWPIGSEPGAAPSIPDQVRVDDVIGVKIIGTPAELALIEAALDARDGTFACESEVHEGSYTGTHYLVDLELPPLDETISRFQGVDWSFAEGRGLSAYHLEESLIDYLGSASPTFRVELILTTLDDLVESEFGRCIHEVRILEQRDRALYSGRIAQNASSIIEYMLELAISPTVQVEACPSRSGVATSATPSVMPWPQLQQQERAEWLVPQDAGPTMEL